MPKAAAAEVACELSTADSRVKFFVDETRKLCQFVFDRCQNLLKSLLQLRVANTKKRCH